MLSLLVLKEKKKLDMMIDAHTGEMIHTIEGVDQEETAHMIGMTEEMITIVIEGITC